MNSVNQSSSPSRHHSTDFNLVWLWHSIYRDGEKTPSNHHHHSRHKNPESTVQSSIHATVIYSFVATPQEFACPVKSFLNVVAMFYNTITSISSRICFDHHRQVQPSILLSLVKPCSTSDLYISITSLPSYSVPSLWPSHGHSSSQDLIGSRLMIMLDGLSMSD